MFISYNVHFKEAQLLAVSLIFIVLLLAVRKRGAGADLAVSVQPFLHHLGDQGVVTAAGALLHGDQEASVCHAAVQPLPQELLLLLVISHLDVSKQHNTSTYTNIKVILS